jgi:hypothetical protein
LYSRNSSLLLPGYSAFYEYYLRRIFMARRGDIAREKVVKTITEAFGNAYLGTEAKKLYVVADDGGEKIQFSISITMPKAEFDPARAEAPKPVNPNDWTTDDLAPKKVEPTAADQAKVDSLLKMLGL